MPQPCPLKSKKIAGVSFYSPFAAGMAIAHRNKLCCQKPAGLNENVRHGQPPCLKSISDNSSQTRRKSPPRRLHLILNFKKTPPPRVVAPLSSQQNFASLALAAP